MATQSRSLTGSEAGHAGCDFSRKDFVPAQRIQAVASSASSDCGGLLLWKRQPEAIASEARVDLALMAEVPQQRVQPAGIAPHNLRAAMGEYRVRDMCSAAPVELRRHGGVADQGSRPPPYQGACETCAVADIDVEASQTREAFGSRATSGR